MHSKVKANFIQIFLSLFWGLNLIWAFLWEIIEKIKKLGSSNEKEIESHSEQEEFEKRIIIVAFIPITFILLFIFIRDTFPQIFLPVFSSIFLISISGMIIFHNSLLFINPKAEKLKHDLKEILYYSLFDEMVFIGFLVFLILNTDNDFFYNIHVQYSFIIAGIIGSLVFSLVIFNFIKKNREKLNNYSNIPYLLAEEANSIQNLKNNIKNIQIIAKEAKKDQLYNLVDLCLKNLRKRYKKLIILLKREHKNQEIKEIKQKYKNIRVNLKIQKGNNTK